MLLNIGLGSKPGRKPASTAAIGSRLWTLTQFASRQGVAVWFFNRDPQDPTVVLDLGNRVLPDSVIETLRVALKQSCIASFDSVHGRRFHADPKEPPYRWKDEEFLFPDGRTLADHLNKPRQGADIPRRDYGLKGA